MDVFYYASWILGVALVLLLGSHMINKKKYDEDKRLKSIKHIKILATILIVCIIITALLVIFLKLDLDIFYIKTSGVVTNNLTDSLKATY